MFHFPDLALAIPREVKHQVVQVATCRHPFANGGVGGYLTNQPRLRDEALAALQVLQQEGCNFPPFHADAGQSKHSGRSISAVFISSPCALGSSNEATDHDGRFQNQRDDPNHHETPKQSKEFLVIFDRWCNSLQDEVQ